MSEPLDQHENQRQVFHGLTASSGMSLGKATFLPDFSQTVPRRDLVDGDEVRQELERLQHSIEHSKNQIQGLLDERDLAREHQAIFEVQIMLLEDPMLVDEARRVVETDRVNCEWAVASTLDSLKEMLVRTNDPIIRERVADLEDIGNRLIANLMEESFDDVRIPFVKNLDSSSILIADTISPTLMLQLSPAVAGIVTEKGGVTGHTAILARDRGIPALVNTGSLIERFEEGTEVLLDADSGKIVVCPSDEDLERYREFQDRMLRKATGPVISPVLSRDHQEVRLWTNLDNGADASDERCGNLEGVGLFRTEFLYIRDPYMLNRPDDQKVVYKDILERIGGRRVTFRLLDLGDDKNLHAPLYSIAGVSTEFTRSLRGVRFLLANPGILAAQLRAIMEAAVETGFEPERCRIMIPMVARLEEIQSVRDVMMMVKRSIEKQTGKTIGNFPLGVMLETPAACLMADVFSPHVDFFSLGTNDLAQYTLAQRRTESRRDDYPFYQPALYRMIHMAILGAKKTISVCGEVGGMPELVPVLLGLGIRDFSVSMASLPAAAGAIASWNLDDAKKLADHVLAASDVLEVRAYLPELD